MQKDVMYVEEEELQKTAADSDSDVDEEKDNDFETAKK